MKPLTRRLIVSGCLFVGFTLAGCALVYVNACWIVHNQSAALPLAEIAAVAGGVITIIVLISIYIRGRQDKGM